MDLFVKAQRYLMFGVAVNHFWKPSYPASVLQSTKFALSLLKNCLEVTTVVLIDSSETYNTDLDGFCRSLEITYRHYGRSLPFSEAYNYGVNCLDEEWVVTMASDIYVKPGTFTLFKEFIENNPGVPIGCLIPYLSSSDYRVQEATPGYPKPTCYSGIMTYNLNIFPKVVFQKLDGLPEGYSGNYNDIVTSIRLQELGLKIVLVDNLVTHYGKLTLSYGTDVRAETDKARFRREYPSFAGNCGLFEVRLDKFLEHPALKLVSRVSFTMRPRRFRGRVENWVHRNLSRIQRVSR